MAQASEKIMNYFKHIDTTVTEAYKVANVARSKGFDPDGKVSIPVAKNMAERVEGLISVVAPQIVNSGVSKRLKELEKKYGVLDWRVSLVIAEEIAQQKYCKFNDKLEAMEIGIRVGFAYHTLGTVASPLEGFVELKPKKRLDGKEYLAVYYSGPIRSAGGTGASVSVIIADYVRKKMGYEAYDPTDIEVKRFVSELYDYHERITNLQYLPSREEIDFMTRHLTIQINGDPSEKIEVSNYKDLDRVETNNIRNGVCLTIGEGLCQKAPKLWKQLSKWGNEFSLEHWNFLEEFLVLQKKIKAGKSTPSDASAKKEVLKITPDHTFIKDLVAGRPVLTHPLAHGGFRLRYGRGRTSGYSSVCINPLTMQVLDKFIATGTQLKLERPGKGATVSPCDSIDGPIIRLKNGTVMRPTSSQLDKTILSQVSEILYLGDMLCNYGDFLNRAHKLVPPGYCEEWWIQELEKSVVQMFGNIDWTKLEDLTSISLDRLKNLINDFFYTKPNAKESIQLSQKLNIPLHPFYTYYWNAISKESFIELLRWLLKSDKKISEDSVEKIILPIDENHKRLLELIGLPHIVSLNEFIVIEKEEAIIIDNILNLDKNKDEEQVLAITGNSTLEMVNAISDIPIRDKAGVFIGARMGRPEKAKMRKLTGSPHVLFPVGEEGGRMRSFQAALELGKIESDFPIYKCPKDGNETIFRNCEKCGTKTTQYFYCSSCGLIKEAECKTHGPASSFQRRTIEINPLFYSVLKNLKMNSYPDLIKGVRGTSNKEHIPEHLAKGILRAKHEIFVDKDGTTRYDMTQMPLTHFKPSEIGTSVEVLKGLGYEKDIHGQFLEEETQVLEILPQDIVLPGGTDSPDEGADQILFRIANYLDDLLVSLYGLEPYYKLQNPKDIIGHLVIALAPHTSAGIIARVIGFSKTQCFFAHPMIHAATRRDCDGDEASINLLMDSLLNFSRSYLPAHRGSTQDACLVITTKVNPTEIDDMIFDIDCESRYPLEFYEACLEYKNPWDIKMDVFGDRLNTERQYEKMGFTHPTTSINSGIRCSAYKTLPSMEEKLNGQMAIAEKIRAVDTSHVASMVIDKHFIKDTKGNLRKFSQQQFRCVACNKKFRRPPLIGRCTNCKGKIIFTISEGSIVKYLQPSIKLAEEYSVPDYIKEHLEIIRRRVEDVFGREKEKQSALGEWA